MLNITNFFSSCFRPVSKNNAEKTEQASGPQPSQASAQPQASQRNERKSFYQSFFARRRSAPRDVAAKAAKFEQFQAQANAELKRAVEQLNAAAAEFRRMTETLQNNANASSSTPRQNEHSSSFSNSSAPHHKEHHSSSSNATSSNDTQHTSHPQPSVSSNPRKTPPPTRPSFFASPSTFLDPMAHITGFNKLRKQINSQWEEAARNFDHFRSQAHHQYQQATQNFDNTSNQFPSQWQQTAHRLAQAAIPYLSYNFVANPAEHPNSNYPQPIHFPKHILVFNSMGNDNLDADVQRAVGSLRQGGFSDAQLNELANDLDTLKQNIRGTATENYEIINSIRQKYANVFMLQSGQGLDSPFFTKLRDAILAGNRNEKS